MSSSNTLAELAAQRDQLADAQRQGGLPVTTARSIGRDRPSELAEGERHLRGDSRGFGRDAQGQALRALLKNSSASAPAWAISPWDAANGLQD